MQNWPYSPCHQSLSRHHHVSFALHPKGSWGTDEGVYQVHVRMSFFLLWFFFWANCLVLYKKHILYVDCSVHCYHRILSCGVLKSPLLPHSPSISLSKSLSPFPSSATTSWHKALGFSFSLIQSYSLGTTAELINLKHYHNKCHALAYVAYLIKLELSVHQWTLNSLASS